ncbi:anaphase-promoting complex subunit cdc20-like [Octopus sinensis]|uniref:Anaphase-promoting complex subunit cdc20-like n=1 Tax=Octopus sinensis TaxID=2607531 RepID=A0A6P7TUJ5_9MOLL|nr:anaphase-promoting complex subunit cdc20-like [Octopus sinensis]
MVDLNVLDCSISTKVAVGLQDYVYIWDNSTRRTTRLSTSSQNDKTLCSVRWSVSGSSLAVGLSTGSVEIWDIATSRVVRSMCMRMGRIASLAWNGIGLTSGSRSGMMFNHDLRVRDHKVHTYSRHSLEVCGLKWAGDGRRLVSGGNDDIACVWDARNLNVPANVFVHQAAVKAVDWSPQNTSLLATGAGSDDKKIRLFNVSLGSEIAQHDTGEQVG